MKRTALACLLLLLLPTGRADAITLLESDYVVWPPAIKLLTPAAGYYVLEHQAADGTWTHVAGWTFEQDWRVTFPLTEPGALYRVRLFSEPAATRALRTTRSHEAAPWRIFLAAVSAAP